METSNFYIYIITNKSKEILYVGITNDLYTRMQQHLQDSIGEKKTFAGKYNCRYLIYYERFANVNHAIDREKEIKGWKRVKKENLINSINPVWNFLNDEL